MFSDFVDLECHYSPVHGSVTWQSYVRYTCSLMIEGSLRRSAGDGSQVGDQHSNVSRHLLIKHAAETDPAKAR